MSAQYTVTLKGPPGTDFNRMARMLRYLFHPSSDEWDSPIPEVDVATVECGKLRELVSTIDPDATN